MSNFQIYALAFKIVWYAWRSMRWQKRMRRIAVSYDCGGHLLEHLNSNFYNAKVRYNYNLKKLREIV